MGTWKFTAALLLFFSQFAIAGPSCGVRGSNFEDGTGSRFRLYFYPHEDPGLAERFDRVLEGYNSQVFSETKWWLDQHESAHKINIHTAYLRILGDLESGATWVGVEGSILTRDSNEDVGAIDKNIKLLMKYGVSREAAEEAIMIRRGAGEFAIYKYKQKTHSKRKIMIIGLDSNYLEGQSDQEQLFARKILDLKSGGKLSDTAMKVLDDVVWTPGSQTSFFERVLRIKAIQNSGYSFSANPDVNATIQNYLSLVIESNVAHGLRDEHMARQIVLHIRRGFGTGTIGSLHQAGMTSFLNEWCKNGKRFPASRFKPY